VTDSNPAGTPTGRLDHAVEAVCRGLAILGGLVLFAMVLMSVGSIVGRAAFSAPILGDFELVQVGCTICVAAFLPYCQLRGGNIIVDFFTTRAPARVQSRLDAFGALLVAVSMAVVAWRTWAGAISIKAAGETTMLLGVPIWIGYALMVPGFIATALVALYMAHVSWRKAKA
jgi:TRAP-type C4-dicarboxylate transport system permease small subunit